MEIYEYESLKASNLIFDNVVEASVSGKAFDARIFRTRWRSSGMAAFRPPLPFIEMMLGATGLVSASYNPRSTSDKLIRLGDVTFIPKNAELHYRTEPGSQRSLSCMFDIDRLAERTGFGVAVAGFRLGRCPRHGQRLHSNGPAADRGGIGLSRIYQYGPDRMLADVHCDGNVAGVSGGPAA